MKLYYKEEPRTIVIASNSYSLGFRALPAPPQLRDQMVGEQLAVAVELLPSSRVTRENGYRLLLNKEIFGCLGLIEIGKKPYLSVITGSIQQVARPIRGESVDKIYAVDFISLVDSEWDFAEERAGAGGGGGGPGSSVGGFDDDLDLEYIHPCTELRKLLSNGSFYYSNDFDLTSLLQNRGVKTLELSQQQQQQNYQKEYMWNTFMMQQLFKFRANLDSSAQKILDDSKIFTTVIRGFAKTVKVNAQDLLTLISKQSWKRAGTRFNARGIDDDGNVANFVESELIFDSESKKQIYSFIQVRGSVPAFWEQDSTLINPKITITRSLEATQPIFDKHFTNSICNKYGVCHVLNLLSKTKPAEVSLSRRYKELYYASNHREEIEFSDFDFHQETKQMGFAGATKILPIIQSSLEQFGWFVYDVQEREIITRQDGIFRTNCLDCLDRTNLIQQVISRNIVENILRNSSSGGHREELYAEDVLARHNLLWADNGDAISQIYTGTNALKSSFSRSGKMNFAGALSDVTKSVSRMYQNTFVDSKKQTLMDILLGNDATARQVKIYNPTNEYVQEQLKSKKKLFTTESNIDIFVGTFNVNAANPMQPIDLTTWLFPPENYNKLPDIFSIGIQEIIELNAGSILAADSTRATMWTKLIENQLNSQGSGEGYLLLRTELIALMTLLLFVKKSKVQHITQVTGSSKKTGLGGIAANKGACAVRFEYGATSFVMITSHLAAGVNATVERYNDYQTIMQGLVFPRNYTIKDHDHIMWFGDLNYRINMPNDQCRSLVEHGAFDELLRTDQLNQEFNTGVLLVDSKKE